MTDATTPSATALLLAAHGERRPGAANESVWRLADALSARGLVSEVGVGFVKGRPTIGQALRALTAAQIMVYPLFASDGYFTRDRLVQLLDMADTGDSRRSVQILSPLGLDPELPALVAEGAAACGEMHGHAAAETALLLIAHGSRRNSASRTAAERIASAVRSQRRFRTVDTAFLEERPFVQDALARMPGPVIVVGLFSGDGLHGAEDAPRLIAALGRNDVIFAGNVGGFPGLADLVAAAIGRADTKGRTARSGCCTPKFMVAQQ